VAAVSSGPRIWRIARPAQWLELRPAFVMRRACRRSRSDAQQREPVTRSRPCCSCRIASSIEMAGAATRHSALRLLVSDKPGHAGPSHRATGTPPVAASRAVPEGCGTPAMRRCRQRHCAWPQRRSPASAQPAPWLLDASGDHGGLVASSLQVRVAQSAGVESLLSRLQLARTRLAPGASGWLDPPPQASLGADSWR
jgi:hypothetical protein